MSLLRFSQGAVNMGASLIVLALCSLSVPAYAQSADDSATDNGGLAEIVVIAQKRSENLQDVPISITALSADDLQARGTNSLKDLQYNVPNLTLFSKSDFNPNYIIRGISSGARNIGFESSLGVYVDGVYMGRTSSANQELVDIDHVEVLRGPQGVLFGKNTISGALNIFTKRPSNDVEGQVSGEYGNYNAIRANAYVSGPIINDKVYAKVSTFVAKRDGYIRNILPAGTVGTGPNRFDNDKTYGARGELRFTPTESLDIALRGDWSHTRRAGDINEVGAVDNPGGFPLTGVVPGIRTVSATGLNQEERTLKGGSLTATYDFDSGAQLVSISALRKLKYNVVEADIDAEPAEFLFVDFADRLNQFTQEVRYVSPSDKSFKYVLGAYYFNQTSDSSRQFSFGGDLKDVFGIPREVPVAARPFGQVKTKSFAFFANVSYALTDALELNVGGRYNNERKTLFFGQEGIPLAGLPDVPQTNDRQKTSDFSPSVGVNFRPSKDVLLYARYAKGFKSGGWNADILSTDVIADIRFRPEEISSYELGLKSELLDRRLRVNVALFNLDYTDLQISTYNERTGQFETGNASARSRGFELEVTARPTDGLDLGFAVGYSNAKYTNYLVSPAVPDPDGAGPLTGTPAVDLKGARLDAPRWTLSASPQYTIPLSDSLDLILRTDFAYRSNTGGDGLDPTSQIPGFATVDARIGFSSKSGWALSLWGRNLTDNDYLTNRFTGGNLINYIGVTQRLDTYGAPRTYGVSGSFKF